jgi:hypothetical protein
MDCEKGYDQKYCEAEKATSALYKPTNMRSTPV